MKKILLFITFLFFFSCNETEKPGVIEETGEIMNDYVDRLESTIGDAKEVRKMIENNQQEFKNNLPK